MSLVFWVLFLGFGLLIYETLFFGHCILVIYIKEVLLAFSQDKLMCTMQYSACLSFSDPITYGYDAKSIKI